MSRWPADDLVMQDNTMYLSIIRQIATGLPNDIKMLWEATDGWNREELLEESVDDNDDDQVSEPGNSTRDFAHCDSLPSTNIQRSHILFQ